MLFISCVSANDLEVLRRLQGLPALPKIDIDPYGKCFGSGMLHFFSKDIRATIDKLIRYNLLEFNQRTYTINDLSVVKLKQILKKYHLPTSGKKVELLERIKNNVCLNELESYTTTSQVYSATLLGGRLIQQSLIHKAILYRAAVWKTYKFIEMGLVKKACKVSSHYLSRQPELQNEFSNFAVNPAIIKACGLYRRQRDAQKRLKSIIITAFLFNINKESTERNIYFLSNKLNIECNLTQASVAYKETLKINAILDKSRIEDLIRGDCSDPEAVELILQSIHTSHSLYGDTKLNAGDQYPILYFGKKWELKI